MVRITERFNHLIEFNTERGLIACEDIISEMDDVITFDHDEVQDWYDREDRTHSICMHFKANDDLLDCIKCYLDSYGFKDQYSIYNKFSNQLYQRGSVTTTGPLIFPFRDLYIPYYERKPIRKDDLS